MPKPSPKKSQIANLKPRNELGRFQRSSEPLAVPQLPPRAKVDYSSLFQAIPNPLNGVFYNPSFAYQVNPENLTRMAYDLDIRAPLQERVTAAVLLNWSIIPQNPKDLYQSAMAEYLKKKVEEIPDLIGLLYWLNHGALWKGRSAAYLDYQWDYSQGFQGLKIASWTGVDGDTLLFDQNGFAGYKVGVKVNPERAFITVEGRGERVTEEERDCWVVHHFQKQGGEFRNLLDAGAIYGTALSSLLYPTWVQKMEILADIGMWAERFKSGWVIYYYDGGNQQSADEVKLAAEKQIGSCVQLVPRWAGEDAAEGVEVIDPPSGLADMMALVEMFAKQIRLAISGQELTSGSEGGGTLGGNLGDIHQNTLFRLVKRDSIALQQTATNQILPTLQRYSPYRDLPPCKFEFSFDLDTAEQKLEKAKLLNDMGIKLDPKELIQLAGFTVPTDTDELTKPQSESSQDSNEEDLD